MAPIQAALLALIDADVTVNAGQSTAGQSRDGQSQSSQQQPQAEEHKKVVVRHLKVNEVLLRVSYDGKPRSFHEVRLLLDEVVTNHFTGRWRDLIGQLKGNVVWSVLKSITGLQGRRLPGNSAHAAAAPTIVKVDSPVKANSLRDKASESETEDAFGDDDEEEDAAADATGSDGGAQGLNPGRDPPKPSARRRVCSNASSGSPLSKLPPPLRPRDRRRRPRRMSARSSRG